MPYPGFLGPLAMDEEGHSSLRTQQWDLVSVDTCGVVGWTALVVERPSEPESLERSPEGHRTRVAAALVEAHSSACHGDGGC